MRIELDWQIVQEDGPLDQPTQPPSPKPRRRLPLRWLIASALGLAAVIASAAIYVVWNYRARLAEAAPQVRLVARLEAQAVAAGDRDTFLALQDPDDAGWRAFQDKQFGRLERLGRPEFGWEPANIPPQPAAVSLEPGGARLDVLVQLSVAQPISGSPAPIHLLVPQFYKQTPSGWVHANLSAGFWGPWQTRSGKYFAAAYTRRDADLIEPLVPRMDAMLARVCGLLPCPPQPIYLLFENLPNSLADLQDYAYGFDDGSFILKLPSPQLIGVPADARSRDEFYRWVGARVVQALMVEASGRQLSMDELSSQGILNLGLAEAGLAPRVAPEMDRALALTIQLTLPSLATLPLNPLSTRADLPPSHPRSSGVGGLVPLAWSFLDSVYGPDHALELIPSLKSSLTLGDVISASLHVNPASLEPAWQAYLRHQAGLDNVPQPPDGELWLGCTTDDMATSSIWRVRTDGSGLAQMVPPTTPAFWLLAWSREGDRLVYLHVNGMTVIDAGGQHVKSFSVAGLAGWLPRNRIWMDNSLGGGTGSAAYLFDFGTSRSAAIAGTYHMWSPDGMEVAYYTSSRSAPTVWVADADGRNARALGSGYGAVWSPDGRRLAYLSDVRPDLFQVMRSDSIEIVDVQRGVVTTLAQADDLFSALGQSAEQYRLGDLSWSPDGSAIAVSMWHVGRAQAPSALVAILDAQTGSVRAQWSGQQLTISIGWFPSHIWSSDGRYLALGTSSSVPSSSVGDLNILDTRTGNTVTVPAIGFWDRSPDGQWFAVPQGDKGVLVFKPDMSAIHRLATGANCYSIAWRP